MAPGETVRPIRSRRFVRLWAEKTVCRVSPVPRRPTTSPYPMSWLSRTPSSDMSSFSRVTVAAGQVAALWNKRTAIRALFIRSLERKNTENNAVEKIGPPSGIADDAFAVDADLHLGQL